MGDAAKYLLVLGEREAIRWVLTTGRMAFPATPRREVAALREADQLFLVTTRGAFHNPTRDRTRVIGTAIVTTRVERFDETLELAGRTFESGCSIEVTSLAPYLAGIELSPLAHQLDALRGQAHWGMLLRRPLVPIGDADAALLRHELGRRSDEISESIASYRDHIHPVASVSNRHDLASS